MRLAKIALRPEWSASLPAMLEWVRGVTEILSGRWTINDQSLGELRSFRWTTGTTITIQTNLPTRPRGITIIDSVTPENQHEHSSGGFVGWKWKDDVSPAQIVITSIDNSLPGGVYDVTLWIVGG